jgi:hypothetical protein
MPWPAAGVAIWGHDRPGRHGTGLHREAARRAGRPRAPAERLHRARKV